jgi:hypothetical protein
VFANRFTAFIDACTLASALRRNLLLTLAEAEFFRVRWSKDVMDETEKGIAVSALPPVANTIALSSGGRINSRFRIGSAGFPLSAACFLFCPFLRR